MCVKPGHPKHLYHVVNNQQQSLDFYIRNDKIVEKKDFTDAFKMMMTKLKDFENTKNKGEEIKIKKFHKTCRFDVEAPITYESEDSDEDSD